ncbi:MAG: mucoidy inhibitor MuiA family protein [Bacteroidia bacterium]
MIFRLLITLAAIAWLPPLHAQLDIPEKKIKMTINEAIVFLNGAQVLRKGKSSLAAGTTDLIIEKLPVRLDPTSIQVKGDGDFTILSVSPQRIDPPKVEFVVDEDKIARLSARQKSLQRELSHVQTNRMSYDQEERILNENRTRISSREDGGLTVEDLEKAAALFRKRYEFLKEAQWQNSQKQVAIQQEIDSLNNVINKTRTPVPIEKVREKPIYNVKVTVSAKRAISNAKLELSYLVPVAGWIPSYDIRIVEVGKPVFLGFRAQVYQATEEDWRDVKLTLSTGNPSRNSIKPELSPWYVQYTGKGTQRNNYNRDKKTAANYPGTPQAVGTYNPNVRRVIGKVKGPNGDALEGVAVVVKGTTIGTFTDASGSYELVIPEGSRSLIFNFVGRATQEFNISSPTINVVMIEDLTLDEVVVTALGSSVAGVTDDYNAKQRQQVQIGKTLPLTVNRVERATNQLYEIATPYSLAGDGRRFAVDVVQYELPAEYAYASAPKIDGNAYLTARVPDWDAFNLMEGDARLFFEDAYLGKTILNTRTVVDTLTLSLGVDDAVVIERKKVKDESKSQLLGLTRKEVRVFEIAVRNTKQQAVRLSVEDQIPLSKDKNVDVKFNEAEGAEYDEETGNLVWDLTLQPGETRRLRLKYTVKFPAEGNLYLE